MFYRQKRYETGNYLEVEIYPKSDKETKFARRRKEKESTPAQKGLNEKKSQRYLVRLIHNNFEEGKTLLLDLTWENGKLPQTRNEALREIRNFIARIRRYRKKMGLDELKYVYVLSNMDNMERKTRYHVHMIINDMDRDAVERLWKKGRCNSDRAQFDECGLTGRVLYMKRQTKGERSWGSSTNLKKPEAVISDNAVRYAHAVAMENNPEDRAFFEKKYPGWVFTDCTVERENEEGLGLGPRFFIRMRKYNPRKFDEDKTLSKENRTLSKKYKPWN